MRLTKPPRFAALRSPTTPTVPTRSRRRVDSAARLLASGAPAGLRAGLNTALYAALAAYAQAHDAKAAALICDALVIPRLMSAPRGTDSISSQQSILTEAAGLYDAAQEWDKEAAALKMLRDTAPTQNSADTASMQLAGVYARRKQYDQAIAMLQTVKSPNMQWSQRYIEDLEAQKQKDVAAGSAANAAK